MVNPIDPLACPECGQVCKNTTGLGVHRSTKHGVPGASNKKTRKKRKVAAAADRVLATGSIPRQPTKPDWSTREVFDAVVSLLYPGSTMPVGALPILLDWRDDTERMLRRLEAL